ncbi:MAG: hypothetical protein HYR77_06525 [Ignavibacteria bacterium]|nr:hypothetical protein [Ignavibacteria bacterium]
MRLYCRIAPPNIVLSFLILTMLLVGCSRKKDAKSYPSGTSAGGYVVVGVEGDIDSFCPLFAEDVTAGEINDLFYPALTSSNFNQTIGFLEYHPLVAQSWEFENGGKDIRFHIKQGLRWSDGVTLTARDVQISYELYADTNVASVRQTSVEGLRKSKDGTIRIAEAVEIINDSTVLFHFDHPYPGQLFDAGLPILPAHAFDSTLHRESLKESPLNHWPLSAGPFKLKSWKAMQQIELEANQSSVLPYPAKLSGLIYRIIPDYHSRLMQLASGEIDVFPYINVEDALQLAQNDSNINVQSLGERFYDAINWNNIDSDVFKKSKGKKIVPHLLFSNSTVRRALTMAINRKEIVDSYLKAYGREAIGPISPIFRWAYNDTLKPLPFNPREASALLAEEGWHDSDGDGILDRGGHLFSFTLKIPSGSQLRSEIATIVQNQLKAVKINVKIEQIERAVFWNDIMEKNFDACIAGFTVPLQMQLDELWGSDLEKSRFNLTSFQNERVAKILAKAKLVENEKENADAWKEFQVILQNEQPCTFLYWMNDLVAVNKRVKGTQIGVLGISYQAGDWYLE